jgi:hypothetical protein
MKDPEAIANKKYVDKAKVQALVKAAKRLEA